MSSGKKTILILLVGFITSLGLGLINEANAQTYYATGTLVSKNLLAGQTVVDSIDYFGYKATTTATTTLKVQFSRNNSNWYSSTGTENGWNTLENGDHLATSTAIDLSALNWSGPNFYYKITFETTDTSKTPILDEIGVNYNIYLRLKGGVQLKGGVKLK